MALYTEEERFKAWGLQMKTQNLNKFFAYENHTPNLFIQKNIFAVALCLKILYKNVKKLL